MNTNKKTQISSKINFLDGKESFTIKDLIFVLNKFDETSEVVFGKLQENGTSFSQKSNFIFRTFYTSREKEYDSDYTFGILTDDRTQK